MDLKKTIKNLTIRGFIVNVFDSKNDVSNYIANAIKNTKVGIGGSKTVDQMGLYDTLLENGNIVYWHWKTPGVETIENANSAPIYICSANAISEDGEIVNIDGNGNRISATSYGQKKLFLIVSTNKIVPTLTDAIERAKSTAAVQNAKRFDYKAPCKLDSKCHDCRVADRICREILIMLAPVKNMDVEILLVNEELGF